MAEEQKIQYFNAKYLDPKYPIVKPDPSVDDVIKGMRSSDYLFITGVMAGTYAYGFLLGKPVLDRLVGESKGHGVKQEVPRKKV